LTISGGTERTTYYLSISRYNNNSVIKGNSDYQRTTVRLKGSQRVTNKINVSGNFAFSDIAVNRIQRGSNVSGLLIGALRTPPDFNNLPYLNEFGVHRSYRRPDRTTLAGTRGYDNPFFIVNEHVNQGDVGRTFGNIKAEYDPFNWLNVSYTLGYDFSEDVRRTVLPIGSSSRPNGRVIREKWTQTQLDGFLSINARKSFRNANVNVILGQQFNQREFKEFRTTGDGMSVFGFNQLENTSSWTPDDDESIIRDESFFGQVMVDLWDQLFLTGTLRNDGSSTFGASERRNWFPAVSGSWEFTKLKAFENIRWLNFGKFRTAYGEAGRQPGAYQTITAFSAAGYGAGWGVFLDATAFGFGGFETSFTKGNDKIKPERNKELELGFDLAFLNNRVGVNVTRYMSKTEDVIFSLPVPRSTGFGAQLQNAGVIENDGWELGIDLKPISLKDFKWDVGVIYARNESLVKDLRSDVSGAERVGLGGFVSANAQAFEGQPYGVIFGEDFIRFGRGSTVKGVNIDESFTGWKPGDLYIGDDGFPVLDPQERVIGDPNPDWTGSVRNTFTLFNKVRISALIDIKNGGDVWNGTKGALYFFGTHKDTDVQYIDDNGQEQRGKREVFEGVGPGAGTEVILDQNSWYAFGLGSGFTGPASQFVEDGSYVKLREISISYSFTGGLVRRSGLRSIDVRLSGRNLKTWTNYTGTDPETNLFATQNKQGFDYFNNPQTRSFVFTVRFNY
jgi:TonB-linked SusC/RagA family outer membrane protein